MFFVWSSLDSVERAIQIEDITVINLPEPHDYPWLDGRDRVSGQI
jgi:hypothetical protein